VTLPLSGPISFFQICDEFSLAHTSVWPAAFYGKGGAPSSGALSFSDFYGRSSGTTYSPAQGSYSATDNQTYNFLTGAHYTVSASASVAWTWTMTGSTASVTVVNQTNTVISSGASATAVTFSLKAAANSTQRNVTITLSSGGKTWTLNLTANGDGGGGATMTL
jgi:hypothetical protein